jgi:hypothetical protein
MLQFWFEETTLTGLFYCIWNDFNRYLIRLFIRNYLNFLYVIMNQVVFLLANMNQNLKPFSLHAVWHWHLDRNSQFLLLKFSVWVILLIHVCLFYFLITRYGFIYLKLINTNFLNQQILIYLLDIVIYFEFILIQMAQHFHQFL